MIELDVTQTNEAIDRLLERTENPRHRFPQIAPLPSFDEAVPEAER